MVCQSRHPGARTTAGLVAGLILYVAAGGFAQVEASVSSRSLVAGERFTYTIQIDYEDPDDVVIPDVTFPGFRLVEGPNVRPVSRLQADQRSRIVEIEFRFEAEDPGRYVLPSVPIQVAGQFYSTPPKLVEVGERRARDRVPFLARWVVPDEPLFVGESRAVLLEIYNVDQFVYPSEVSVKPPAQAIFEEVQGLGSIGQSVVDGVTLFQIPVAVFMVTPSAAGTIRLESAQVEWDGMISTAPPGVVAVVDPPELISASGAVGRFTLSAATSHSTISAGETVDLTVRLDGEGNLHFLQIPPPVLDGLDIEDETREDRFVPVSTGYSGFIAERFTLRPTGTGTSRISFGPFTYYDRSEGRVIRIRIPELAVHVTPVKEPMTATGPQYTFSLLQREGIASVEPRNWYRNPASLGFLAPGLLLFVAVRIWKRRDPKIATVALAVLLLSAAVLDDVPWTQIDRGLARYEAGDIAGAIHAFEDASRRAPRSPGVLHNLAVLYFQVDDVGRSVFAAREAVRFNPSSGVLRGTQELVEDAAGLDRSVPVPQSVHPDIMFIALAAAINVFFVLLAFVGKLKGVRRVGLLAIGNILVGVAIVALGVGFAITAGQAHRQVGVVLKTHALHRIPEPEAERWLQLVPGTAVEVVTEKNGFYLVRTSLGLEGWVEMDSILWPQNPANPVLRFRAFGL